MYQEAVKLDRIRAAYAGSARVLGRMHEFAIRTRSTSRRAWKRDAKADKLAPEITRSTLRAKRGYSTRSNSMTTRLTGVAAVAATTSAKEHMKYLEGPISLPGDTASG